MQRTITDALWDEHKMLSIYHEKVHKDLADPNATMIFDESGFVKKGKAIPKN